MVLIKRKRDSSEELSTGEAMPATPRSWLPRLWRSQVQSFHEHTIEVVTAGK